MTWKWSDGWNVKNFNVDATLNVIALNHGRYEVNVTMLWIWKINWMQHEFENENKDGAEDFLRRKTRVSKMTVWSTTVWIERCYKKAEVDVRQQELLRK